MKFLIFVVVWNLLSTAVNCNYITLKGNALSNDAAIYSLNCGVSNNQLSCARKCKQDKNCDGLVYNNTDGLCGLVAGNGVVNTSQRLTGTSFKVVSRTEKICGKWQKVLSVNNSGGIISGSFENLKAALHSGKKVQIVYGLHSSKTLSHSINSALANENVVCGQSERYVVDKASFEIRYLLLCTNGRIQYLETNMNQTGSVKLGKVTNVNKIDWFVFEDACQQVTLKDSSKPYITFNNVDGFSGTVVERLDAITKVNYETHARIYHTNEEVEMTTLGEIYSTFIGDNFEFDTNASWISTKYNISKNVEEISCTISDNIPCTHYNKNVVNRTIYVDGNWEKVFIHTSEGNEVFGSLPSLREQVLNGHKLLIYFSGKVKEPDIVIVDEDNFWAVFSSYPLKQSDSNQTKAIWEMVSTSGKYEVAEFDFETGNVLSITTGTSECSWFVDKATWTIVHDSESNTTEKLFTAIESGSDIRIKSNCLHVNENSTLYSCLYGAVNMYYQNTNSVGISRAIVCPGVTVTGSGLQLSIDEKPVWMSLLTSTRNVVKKKLWMHRASHFKGDTMMIHRDNTWFGN